MSEVTRWMVFCPHGHEVEAEKDDSPYASWVRWDDCAALAARVAELEGALGKIARFGREDQRLTLFSADGEALLRFAADAAAAE